MNKPLHILFSEFIQQNKLFNKSDKLLLAFSGGIDSVVLTHLLIHSGFNIELAHFNFQLRGEESNGDEDFVTYYAEQNHIPIHIKRFDTKKFANKNNLTIQEAARNLRYDFFYEMVAKKNFTHILTAHHLDDSIETFFINLLRGTGIKGLCGIPLKNEKITRPLLFATRQDIYDYAIAHSLSWREDSSNQSDKYMRNQIRHHLIPLLISLQPNFYEIFKENLRHINDSQKLLETLVKETINSTLQNKNNDEIIISVKKLKEKDYPTSLLFHFLQTFQFNEDQVNQMLEKEHQSGKKFIVPEYTAVYDRDSLIISKNKESDSGIYWIEKNINEIKVPINLVFSIKKYSAAYSISKNPHIACLDADKLQFPLQLRKWQPGDYFYPFGMEQVKKLSNFFIDNKKSLIQKENIWVLLSNNSLIWIVGQRIDNRFRITDQTKNVLEIRLK